MMIWRSTSTPCSTDSEAIWMYPVPVAMLRWNIRFHQSHFWEDVEAFLASG